MKKLLCLLSVLFVFSAQAGILIEPYAGYEGSVVTIPTNIGDVEMANKGMSVGFRGGLTFGPAFAAVDFETGSRELVIEEDPTNSLKDESVDMKNLGVAFGIDVPVMPIRIFGKYIMNAELDDVKGSGTSLGIGLTFLPVIDINIEYRNITYDEDEDGDEVDITSKGLMFGISAPFTL